MEIFGAIRDRVPIIPIAFYGQTIDACVDTGFNGSLLIPLSLAQRVGLDYRSDISIETATGARTLIAVYQAELTWLGQERRIDVLAPDVGFILLGMALLEEGRLELEPAKGLLRISST